MLSMTVHARQRWMARAPRYLRTSGAIRDACRYARCHGQDPESGDTLYVALGMVLVVRGESVVTVIRSTWRSHATAAVSRPAVRPSPSRPGSRR